MEVEFGVHPSVLGPFLALEIVEEDVVTQTSLALFRAHETSALRTKGADDRGYTHDSQTALGRCWTEAKTSVALMR